MIEPVLFVVYGDPSPQGGTKSVPINTKSGKRIYRKVTEGGVNLKSWRQEIAGAAEIQAQTHGCHDGPLRLEVEFRFAMPKSRPRWAILQKFLLRISAPDLDKLVRAVGDSLTAGGLIVDDRLICQCKSSKVEVFEGWTGVAIRVTPLDQRTFRGQAW